MNEFNQREEAFFQKCLELPPDEREPFIVDSCPDDHELRESVLELVKAHRFAGDFLDELPESDYSDLADQLHKEAPPEERAGDQFGRYHLLELIGEGSWGSVWLAEQTEDIKRRVALKILKLGLDADEFLERFEAERQVLAMMDHPNIARVLDAGTTFYGRPFLIMELVKSMPLIEFADRENLGIEERVKLFIQICHGVHHAHQKGVIHRDLKPSNILVAVYDDKPVPKIIDFGVAKTTFFRNSNTSVFFGAHSFIGTPVYCSPEQLDFRRLDVDHRSDIYSLGALLYELLSGCLPFDPDPLANLDLDEIRRIVSNTRPPTPLVQYKKATKHIREKIAEKRSCRPSELEKSLRGDVESIAMKCLEKSPSHRYGTASDLANDLEAFLDDGEVAAAPSNFAYRAFKYIRSNRPTYALWIETPALVLLGISLFLFLNTNSNYNPFANLENPNSKILFANQSIAVLPFDELNPGNDPTQLPENLQRDLSASLSKLEDTLVVSPISTLRYRDTNKSFQRIGNELGVRFLIDGSVQRTDNRIYLNIRLHDTMRDRYLWADTYDCEYDELSSIQNEIIGEIDHHLNAKVAPLEEIDSLAIPPRTP